MITCASLTEAAQVPGVILIVASVPPVAYVQGDALPAFVIPDPTEISRISAIDNAISTATVGTVTPQTLAQLKLMDNATYSSWFDANFTTAAQAITLLKRVVLVLIRRVF